MTLGAVQKTGLMAGLIGAAGCVVGALTTQTAFYEGYLQAYGFWISMTLGSLGLLLIHGLTGGRWGREIRPMLSSAVKNVPFMALLFIPIVLGMKKIYPWLDHEAVAHSPLLSSKVAWLNLPFFLGRTVFYFVVWIVFGTLALRRPADRPHGAISGMGVLFIALTASFAAIDWYMSLEPEWFSSLYGGLFIVSSLGACFCMCVITNQLFRAEGADAGLFHDLGKFMLMSVMLWAYLNFSQYLIIWSAKLPEEMTWYHHRMHGGWQLVGATLLFLHFVVPFSLLLSRDRKRSGKRLVRVAFFLLALRFIDFWWWVGPAFHPEHINIPIWSIVAFVAIGGFWTWGYTGAMRRFTSAAQGA